MRRNPRSEGIIMHGELRIGEAVVMFADATEQFSARPAGIFIYVENTDETYKKAMAAGSSGGPCRRKNRIFHSHSFKNLYKAERIT